MRNAQTKNKILNHGCKGEKVRKTKIYETEII